MSLLQAVKHYLGSIHMWPAYIITYIFAETPSPQVVKEFTAFFAGNGVPKTFAYRLYNTCNPEVANEFMRQLFYARFFCGTLQTPSDATPCIMMYVSRNTYV